MLEARPDFYSASCDSGRLLEAKIVFAEFKDLEAMLPREPRSRGRPVATLVKRTRIAVGTRNQYRLVEFIFSCHSFLPLDGRMPGLGR